MMQIETFKDAIQMAGMTPPPVLLADGQLHRYDDPRDKRGSGNAWYVLHDDGHTAGAYGDWKRGIAGKWSARGAATSMSAEERAALDAQIEADRNRRAEENEKKRARCRERAKMWERLPAALPSHPYLQKKRIKACGTRSYKSCLVVPVRDGEGVLQGLQFIPPEGKKRFLTATAPNGCYFSIGKLNGGPLLITEGFATGATLHEVTNHAVAVAFNAGNLKAVAENLRKKFPAIEIIMAADDDHATDGNPGITKAWEAALAVNGKAAVPVFPEGRGDKDTDFNDLCRLSGADSVKSCIEKAARPDEDRGTVVTTAADTWPEPFPLPDGLPPVKTLNPVMIPAPLRGWLMDISDRMQIPPDFSTAAAIVVLGSIIGRGCGIYPKRHDDWLVVPNLWGAVVGRPSLMKSPAISEAQKHLSRLETEAKDEYQKAADAFETDKEIMKFTRAAIGEEIKKAVKRGEDIEEARGRLSSIREDAPIRRRYQTQDGTSEKIGELLNQNPRGILINRDELMGWFRSLDRDGREGDRAFYLEGWNGDKGFTYDRIGRGTLDISALCVSIFGAITPGPLSSYVYQANRGGNGDDGLLQRFQVFVWPDAPSEWKNIDRFPDTTEKQRTWKIYRALSEDIPGAVTEDGAAIPALRFSPGGQGVFDEWRLDLETRTRNDSILHPAMESHLTKYRKLMPSLALIFHLVAVADGAMPGPVSDTAALMAASWCDYLESHAGRIYGGATMPGMDAAREIVKHIRRGGIHDGCTPKDIYRNHWARLTTPEEAKGGLDVLEEYDWLKVDKVNTGGRPTEIIVFNPRLKL